MENVTFPFEITYLVSIIFAAISCIFIPFMVIPRQGEGAKDEQQYGSLSNIDPIPSSESERPRTGGEYFDGEYYDGMYNHHELMAEKEWRFLNSNPHAHTVKFKPSHTSLWSAATAGSMDSYFPRWSWEGGDDGRFVDVTATTATGGGGSIVYEVCIKCLEERKVMLLGDGNPHYGQSGSQHWPDRPIIRRDENGHILPFLPYVHPSPLRPSQRHLREQEESSRSSLMVLGDGSEVTVNGFESQLRIEGLLHSLPAISEMRRERQGENWQERLRPLGDPGWGMNAGRPMNLDGVGSVQGRMSGHPVDGLLHYLNRYESRESRDWGMESRVRRDDKDGSECGKGRLITSVGRPPVGVRRSSWGKGMDSSMSGGSLGVVVKSYPNGWSTRESRGAGGGWV